MIHSVLNLIGEEYPWQVDLGGGMSRSAPTKEELIAVCPDVAIWLETNQPVVVTAESLEAQQAEHSQIRLRNSELADTDHLMLSDAPITDACKEAVVRYRQELRDYPRTRKWPVKPMIVPKHNV